MKTSTFRNMKTIAAMALALGAGLSQTSGANAANLYEITLKSTHGKYVVAEKNGTANVNRSRVGAWEKWILNDLNGGRLQSGDTVTFRSAHGKYLVAESNGTGLSPQRYKTRHRISVRA